MSIAIVMATAERTAHLADLAAGLGADSLVTLAGQNVAGSFAIIVPPPRITLAAAVVSATVVLCAAVAVLA